ncbi:MauE/DoxX family redox-associated membrane protein [Pedobacter sp. SYP-B3415]|uniref:MauE/DoxX family redox-associated membrane protein n=1 Tax=Pedobacter sp. SYP-B3415 TaxID=2496641 RepID=UPI00101CA745|nr:MauE/DoxX family redox-associated membrane protein [Pedobacter sp. SYP-B3415]
MKIVKLVICILFGLLFLNAGLDKFFHYMPMPELTEAQKQSFAAFGQIVWLMPLVGAIEVLGGILFMIPKTRALGALVILPVMAGIFLQALVVDQTGLPMAAVLLLINLWIIFDSRKKYQPMLA